MNRKWWESARTSLLLLFLLCSLCTRLVAQIDTGTLMGVVQDPSGAAIPGVRVVATNIGTNISFSAISVETGEYRIFTVPAGEYIVAVEKEGFKKAVRTGIVMQANNNVRVDLTMEVGALTQEVTVAGEAPQVDTGSAQVGQTVTSKQIVDLPLGGRNTAALVMLVPGVTSFTQVNWWGWSTTWVVANGARFQNKGMEWLLDGGMHTQAFVNSASMMPNPDAIQEFQYLGSQRSAEFGRMGSASVSVVAKSGTNALHGSLWDFHRNAALNAMNYNQSGPNAKQVRNQFGFTVGGPVWIPKLYNGKNKSFFFTSWQGYEQREKGFSFNVRLPTALERSGDFSNSPILPINPDTMAPYPGGKLPAIDPVIAKIWNKLPQGDPNTGLWQGTAPNPFTQKEFLAKGDHYLSDKHRLSFHYFRFDENYTNQQGSTVPVPGYSDYTGVAVQQSSNFSHTWTISPTKLNVFHAVYARVTSDRGFPIAGNTLQALGAKGYTDNSWQSPPKFSIGGGPGVGGTYFQIDATNSGREWSDHRQFKDTFRWTRGVHSLSLGGEFVSFLMKEASPAENWLYFRGKYTGNALADFYMGVTDTLNPVFVIPPPSYRHNLYSWFVQDDWKVTRRLALNVGLRWEFLEMPVAANDDGGTTFMPWVQSKVLVTKSGYAYGPPGTLYFNPYTKQQDEGWRRGGWLRQPKVWSPRFGFAYDLFGKGKTSLRGGIGLYSSSLEELGQRNGDNPFRGNPPAPPPRPSRPGVGGAGPFAQVSDPWNYPGGFDIVERSKTWSPSGILDISDADAAQYFGGIWSVGGWDPNYVRPTIIDWSFGIQQQLPHDTYVEVSYVANLGRHLWYNYQLFAPWYQPGADTSDKSLACRTSYLPCKVMPVFVNGTIGTMNYHGMHVFVNRRFNRGLSFTSSYTFSKAIDTNSWPVQDFNRLFDEHSRSDDDRRHISTSSFIYEPPYLKFRNKLVNFALGGWQISGILNFQSGNPFTVRTGTDNLKNTYYGARPILTGNPYLDPNRPRSEAMNAWINKSAFVDPGAGHYGIGRNMFDNPGSKNLDSSMTKLFHISEAKYFQFRWEMYNAFNWVNLGSPHNTLNDPQFGQITSVGSMRRMQLSLKFTF